MFVLCVRVYNLRAEYTLFVYMFFVFEPLKYTLWYAVHAGETYVYVQSPVIIGFTVCK